MRVAGVILSKRLVIYSYIVIFLGSVWHFIYSWIGISAVIPFYVPDHFVQFSFGGGNEKRRHSVLQVIWFATV